MAFWTWMYVLSGWLIALVMLPILARRYPPAKAWAWLVVFFVAPWFGLGLYLLLGDNPLGRKRVVRYRRITEALGEGDYLRWLDGHVAEQPMRGHFAGLDRLAIADGAMRPVRGNAVEFIPDLPAFVDRLIESIDRAEHHVHLIVYIYRDDETGRRVADALVRAAGRGVQCRLILDAVGARDVMNGLTDWLEQRGVEVRFILPLNPLRGRLIRLDVRNHRKIAVIDGRTAYTGSGNITDPDYGHKIGPYHELMVRLRGPIVHQLQLAFFEDWCQEPDDLPDDPLFFPEPREEGASVAQLVPDGPVYPHSPLRDVTLAAVHDARKRIVITTPYLLPDETFLAAVRLAARRGVRVDLIFPSRNDALIPAAAARPYFRDMLASGVHIHLYQPGMLHDKIITVDGDVGMVGSGNFDIRSFRLNVEANVLLYTDADIDRLVRLQDEFIERSEQLGEDFIDHQPMHQRLFDDVAKLLGPLM